MSVTGMKDGSTRAISVHDGRHRGLLDERAVADAMEEVDLALSASDGQVLEPVPVVVADRDLGHASADRDLARGLERAVAVADHDGDHL